MAIYPTPLGHQNKTQLKQIARRKRIVVEQLFPRDKATLITAINA